MKRPSKTNFPPEVKDRVRMESGGLCEFQQFPSHEAHDFDHYAPRSCAPSHPAIASPLNCRTACRKHHDEITLKKLGGDRAALDFFQMLVDESVPIGRIAAQRTWEKIIAPHYRPLRKTVSRSGVWEWVDL